MTQALQYIEVDVDHCSLTYSVAPCQASLTSPATGTDKCFNTLQTCQDRANFATETFTYRFAVPTASLPSDIDCIPNIKSITFDSAQISLGENLGSRATITITFEDHKHSDTGIDKYLADRTYNPYEQGTFFGKFRARIPFLRGRNLRWINGTVGQALAAMETRYYIIDSFSGPTNTGEYVLIAKDVLKLADGDRSLAPVPNTGYLAADITNVATTLTLLPTGAGDLEYPATGYAAIGGSEIVHFTHQSGFASGSGPNAVNFDGTNDWLSRGGGLIGAADSKLFTISGWIRKPNATISARIFVSTSTLAGGAANATTRFITDTVSGFLNLNATNAAGTTICNIATNFAPTPNIWYHFLCSVDMSSTAKRWLYINDVTHLDTVTTYTNDIIDFTQGDWAVGAYPDGTVKVPFDLAELWAAPGVYIDFSVEANRRLFITSDFRPVPLGATGNLPTGTAPLVYFGNPFGTWQTNLGTGGGFTLHGALTAVTLSDGDNLNNLLRGQLNTTAAAHSTNDRVQNVLSYAAQDPANIISDLLRTYADVSSSFIPITDWLLETATYLNRLYTANIPTPTAVSDLLSELIEQAGLALWWDDLNQEIGLIVLRGFVTGDTFTQDNVVAGTLDISEQPDRRLSEVDTYFGQINPLVDLTNKTNFKSVAIQTMAQLATDYGSPAIKEIFSRWIPANARATADRVNSLLLSRYQDPPRHFKFSILRGSATAPLLAHAYNLNAWPLQDALGAAANVGFQVTRLRPMADLVEIEGDELLFTAGASDLGTRNIIYDANALNQNAKTTHDLIYPPASSGDAVAITVASGIIIGSGSVATPALDIGTWPAGVTVSLTVLGRIQGHGGQGAIGQASAGVPGNGEGGGTALYTRNAISLTVAAGQVWGGAGGGGGRTSGGISGGGGGGAGTNPGIGGAPGGVGTSGSTGTAAAGGAGGSTAGFGVLGNGGAGGTPGAAGSPGNLGGGGGSVGTGGAAGNAIDGISFVTVIGGAGSRLGPEIN